MSNSSQVKGVLSRLAEFARRLNPSILKHYVAEIAVTIWTEGGEWPAYNQKYEECALARCDVVDIRKDYYIAESINTALIYISETLTDYNSCAVTMPCGAGKSTQLVKRIHDQKIGYRTIVVQPSIIIASELVAYLNRPDIVVAEDMSKYNTDVRKICYMNPGVFLDACARSLIDEDDLIIMDEAHTSTFMYHVALELLRRLHNKVVLLTASTTDNIPKRRNVRLHSVNCITPEMSETFASDTPYLTVGVMDNLTYAIPANAITGVTFPELQVVYDTGLRPEPRVKDDSVILGERQATICEIIQTVGRLGRVDIDGDAYFNTTAIAMKKRRGIPLYDVLLSSILIVLGFKEGDRTRATSLWANSGLIKIPEDLEHLTVETDVGIKCEVDQVLSIPDHQMTAIVPIEQVGHHTRYSSMTTSNNKYKTAVATRCSTAITDKLDQPALQMYWQRAAMLLNRGNLLYFATIPFVDDATVDVVLESDCRYILAQRILPSFDTKEIACIIALWNKYVISLGGKPADMRRVSMFVKYFEELYHFNVN